MTTPTRLCGPWVLAVLAWLWLGLTIAFELGLIQFFLFDLLLAAGWLALAVAWLLVLILLRDSLRPRSGKLWYGSATLTLVLGWVLTFAGLGLTVRVALSEPQLLAYVAEVPPGSREFTHEPRRVGLLLIDGDEGFEGLVLLYTPGGFIDREGVAYNPSGRAMPERTAITGHLYGPWYRFVWRF